MKIIDPAAYFGIPSGMAVLRLSAAEKATLLRAAAIVERAHDVLEERQGDWHYEGEPSLCGIPGDLRELATDGLSVEAFDA